MLVGCRVKDSILEFRQQTDIINMAYTQLIKTLQRNLQQLSRQYSRQKSFYLHTRNASIVSKFTFCRHIDVVSPCSPVSSYPVKTPGCHRFSLYLTARNKSSPEDKDKSISRYQSGAPKTSTAQKGKTQSPVSHNKIK